MTEKLKWGIIGAGNVVEFKSGPSLQQAEDSQVIAMFSRTYSKAKNLAEKMNIPRVYNTKEEFFSDPEIEAVYISTPPDSHYNYAIEAIEAGKHVLVEKPMATSVTECEGMTIKAAEKNVVLMTAYYRRFWPSYCKIKSIIDSGEIGNIIYLSLNFFYNGYPGSGTPVPWRLEKEISGGGLFVDVGSHRLDMANFLVGNFKKVIAIATRYHSELKVEDTVGLLAETETNAHVHGYFSFNLPVTYDSMQIVGTRGRIIMDVFDSNNIELQKDDKRIIYTIKRTGPTHLGLVNHFIKVVKKQQKPMIDGLTGTHINRIIEASYKSAETGNWIEIF